MNNKMKIWTKYVLLISLFLSLVSSPFNVAGKESLIPSSSISVTGANVDESKVTLTVYVDGQNEAASDKNPGTADQPFKSLAIASQYALQKNKEGVGVKLLIREGLYREKITIDRTARVNEAPFIIEGEGDVILKGSVILKDPWKAEGDYYTNSWIMDWGPTKNVYEDEYDVKMDEIVLRKEMIFVNEEKLEQVLSKDELKPGRFFMDEKNSKAYLMPPEGVDMETALVEIPIYDQLLHILEGKNVVVRNLTFRQSNPYHPGSQVIVYKGENVLIEDCDISDGNWFGLGIFDLIDVTINRCTINGNGGGGIQGSHLENVLIVDSQTSGNNWRGQQGDYYAWDTSGIKLLFAYDVKVLRHQANNNFANGIWFDSECRNIIIEDCITFNNDGKEKNIIGGLYLEGSIGPFYVTRCIMSGNNRGINIASSNDIYIRDSIITDNKECQINVFNNWGQGRTFEAKNEEKNITSYAQDTIIEDTIIAGIPGDDMPLIDYDWGDPGAIFIWTKTLRTANLTYYHSDPSTAFLTKDTRGRMSFDDWREMTGGLDGDAVWIESWPLNLKVDQKAQGEFDLSWETGGSAIENYKIYDHFDEVGSTGDTTYSLKAQAGSEHMFYVRGVDKSGKLTAPTNLVYLSAQKPEVSEPDSSSDIDDEDQDKAGDKKGEKSFFADNAVFIIIAAVMVLLILGLLIWFFLSTQKTGKTKDK